MRSRNLEDGLALHGLLSRRAAARSRKVDLREVRDLGLIAALSALVPTTVLALEVGAARPISGLLLALSGAAAACWLVVLRNEYGIDPLDPATAARPRSLDRATATPRLNRVPLLARVAARFHSRAGAIGTNRRG